MKHSALRCLPCELRPLRVVAFASTNACMVTAAHASGRSTQRRVQAPAHTWGCLVFLTAQNACRSGEIRAHHKKTMRVCGGGEKKQGGCWRLRRPFAEFRELGVWGRSSICSRNRISVIVSCRLHSARIFCFFSQSPPPSTVYTFVQIQNNPPEWPNQNFA